jgi:hypothetical protein
MTTQIREQIPEIYPRLIVNTGFIINSTYIPAIMLHEKKYENRTFSIKAGFYALYSSKAKPKMLKNFFDSFPNMKGPTMEKLGSVQGNIVGILHVKNIFKKGDTNYPIDPYATGEYVYAIDFIPIPEFILGEYKAGQVTRMSLTEATKVSLSNTLSQFLQQV